MPLTFPCSQEGKANVDSYNFRFFMGRFLVEIVFSLYFIDLKSLIILLHFWLRSRLIGELLEGKVKTTVQNILCVCLIAIKHPTFGGMSTSGEGKAKSQISNFLSGSKKNKNFLGFEEVKCSILLLFNRLCTRDRQENCDRDKEILEGDKFTHERPKSNY